MTPYYADPLVTLHLGDCLEVMPGLEAESVDAVVTDGPYGISFMGRNWDHGVPATPFWAEMYRVAKPGAYLLAFGGTRTVHRIATNIEDAEWIIRDMLMWIYASGFPKGKANLKPAHEPIVLARKPGPLRPLAIDDNRIGTEQTVTIRSGHSGDHGKYGRDDRTFERVNDGRWPSNVLLSDPELFDEPNPWVVGSGATTTDGVAVNRNRDPENRTSWYGTRPSPTGDDVTYGGAGGYSRFFIIPKADRAERERGLTGDPVHVSKRTRGDDREWDIPGSHSGPRLNHHPTVKPIDLMRHLVRLVTPPGGVVLDPFLGSGSTALAASEEGFRCIGIEREPEYLEIAKGRLMATPMGLGLDVPAGTKRRSLPSEEKLTEWGKTYKDHKATSIWRKGDVCTCDHERPDSEHRPSSGCLMCEWCAA